MRLAIFSFADDDLVNDLALFGFVEFRAGDLFKIHRVFPQKPKLQLKLLILTPDLLKFGFKIFTANLELVDLHQARRQ